MAKISILDSPMEIRTGMTGRAEWKTLQSSACSKTNESKEKSHFSSGMSHIFWL